VSVVGRTVAVTGANGGIGSHTALGLAKLGAHVVLVCRSQQRADKATAFVRAGAPGAQVSSLAGDLSRLADIRRVARDLGAAHPRLSVLVNNAGVICRRRVITEDGFELTWAVNHVAPFVLSTELLDVLRANAPARIVNVNSDSHLHGTIDFDDLNAERGFWPPRAYERSKLANVLFTKELARRVDPAQVTVNALHPGLVNTDFGEVGGIVEFGWRVYKHFGITPAEGARTPVYLATSPEVAGKSGGYYRKCLLGPVNPLAEDAKLATRLWEQTERTVREA
jgi:NAD(P)-dependent dehydrogenase (short-subunit alcohol dehydrogenase family)